MNVKYENFSVPLSSLEPGDIFYSGGNVYIRGTEIKNDTIQVTLLEKGYQFKYRKETQVIPLNEVTLYK